MNQPERRRGKARRSNDLTQELAGLAKPLSPDQVAAVAARHAIRRLKLEDDKRTWATLKAVIEEAVALRVA